MHAMRQIGFVDITARIGLRSDDVILGLGKVEPVFRTVVKLKSQLRAAIVLRNAVPDADLIHLAVTICGSRKGIAHQPSERSGDAIGARR